MTTSLPHGLLAAALALGGLPAAGAAELVFRDGHRLKGEAVSAEAGGEVRWRHPAADGVTDYALGAVERMALAAPEDVDGSGDRVGLRDGTRMRGRIETLTPDRLTVVPAWGSRRLRVERRVVERLAPDLDAALRLHPDPGRPAAWQPQALPWAGSQRIAFTVDRMAFRSRAAGTLVLPDAPARLMLAFHAEWQTAPHFTVAWIGDPAVEGGFTFPAARITVNKVHALYLKIQNRTLPGSKNRTYGLGEKPFATEPAGRFSRPGAADMVVCMDREAGRIAVIADGVVLGDWRLAEPTDASADRIALVSRGTPVNIERFRVLAWDGVLLPAPGAAGAGEDRVAFADAPAVRGRVLGIEAGRLRVRAAAGDEVERPLDRVLFAELAAPAPSRAPEPAACPAGLVTTARDAFRADFVRLEGNALTVRIDGMGEVAFDRARVARLTFGAAAAPPPAADSGSELLFLDGSSLPGALLGVRPAGGGVEWACPYARQPVRYDLAAVREIRLPSSAGPPAPAPDMLRLTNGDSVPGTLLELDADRAVFEAARIGRLEVDRRMLERLERTSALGQALYRGPAGLAGWTRLPDNERGWQAEGDSLVAPFGRNAAISRQVPAPEDVDAVAVEFVAAWKGRCRLSVRLWEGQGGRLQLNLYDNRFVVICDEATGKQTRSRWGALSLGAKDRARFVIVADRRLGLMKLYADGDGQALGSMATPLSAPLPGNGLTFMATAPVALSDILVRRADRRPSCARRAAPRRMSWTRSSGSTATRCHARCTGSGRVKRSCLSGELRSRCPPTAWRAWTSHRPPGSGPAAARATPCSSSGKGGA